MYLTLNNPVKVPGLGAAPANSNRLLDIETQWLIRRRDFAKGLAPYLSYSETEFQNLIDGKAVRGRVWSNDLYGLLFKTGSSKSEVLNMWRMAKFGLSNSEYSDLTLIDWFFQAPLRNIPLGYSTQEYLFPDKGDIVPFCIKTRDTSSRQKGQILSECQKKIPGFDSAFFYPDSLGSIQKHPHIFYYQHQRDPALLYWNLDIGKKWGNLKQQVLNANLFEEIVAKYPFPSPPAYVREFWMRLAVSDIRNLVLQNVPVSEEDIRDFITTSVVQRYNVIINEVRREFNRQEDAAKRKALIKGIAGLAISVVLAFTAPAVVGMIYSTSKTALDLDKKRRAASEMVNAAKQFAATDKAFSEEILRVSRKLDAQAKATVTADDEKEMVKRIDAYRILVEGKEVGVFDSPEEALRIAEANSVSGDRVQVFFGQKRIAYLIRVPNGFLSVPEADISEVDSKSPNEIREVVVRAYQNEKKKMEKEADSSLLPLLIPVGALFLLGQG